MLGWLRWCRRTVRRGWRSMRRHLRDRVRPAARSMAKPVPAPRVEVEARTAPSPKIVRTDQDYIDRIRGGIDLVRWNALRDEWAGRKGRAFNPGYHKYFDLDLWLPHVVTLMSRAGLTESGRQRILDIGCGGGLFGRACAELGHDVTGMDVGNPMFMAMCEFLGVPCRVAPVRRGEKLPGDLRDYDWITAIAPKFYLNEKIAGRMEKYNWADADWDFLLCDLRDRLRPDGRLLIRFNREESLPPGLWRRLESCRRLDRRAFILRRDDLPTPATSAEAAVP